MTRTASRTFVTLRALVGAAVLVLSGTAIVAGTLPPSPVLVELFTSEGCSSCPPADRLLAELDRTQPVNGAGIIVLSEHVDYWNSLGWRDPYSSHLWSERQSTYASHFGLDSVYTPQIVIAGNQQVVGNDGHAVRTAIQKSASQPRISISIGDVSRTSGHVRFTYSSDAAPNAALYVVLADSADRSSVSRGENAGRTLDHVAVARSLTEVGPLQSAVSQKTLEVAIPQDDNNRPIRVVLFAQDRTNGSIVGVAAREL